MKMPIDWLSGKTVLTTAQVKKMEPGEYVYMHQCYGRRGEHVWSKAMIVQSGRKKLLQMRDYNGLAVLKEIRTAENIAYTAD